MMHFTEEEKHLIAIYSENSRMYTVSNMQTALPYIEDADMKDLMKSAISKLLKMTEKEFRLIPDSTIN